MTDEIIGIEPKLSRCNAVNELIRVIGSHGRQFFQHEDNFTTFEIGDDGRIWIIDHYSRKRVCTRRGGPWKGFTNGGTLRALCEDFRKFIGEAKQLSPWWISYREGLCNPYLFGNEKANDAVRDAAIRLGIVDMESAPYHKLETQRLRRQLKSVESNLAAETQRADALMLIATVGWELYRDFIESEMCTSDEDKKSLPDELVRHYADHDIARPLDMELLAGVRAAADLRAAKHPATDVRQLKSVESNLAAETKRADNAELVAFLGWTNFGYIVAMGIGKKGDTRPSDDIVASMFADLFDEIENQCPGGKPSTAMLKRIRDLGADLRASKHPATDV